MTRRQLLLLTVRDFNYSDILKKERKMRKMIVGLIISAFILVGCTGSFHVTRLVYNMHRDQTYKWVDEAIFVGCVVFPVYGMATIADALIFNTVEFWSGRNPVALPQKGEETACRIVDDRENVVLSYDTGKDVVRIHSLEGSHPDLMLKRSADGVLVCDASGSVLYSASRDGDGGVLVYDRSMQSLRYHKPAVVAAERARFEQQAAY